MPGAHVGVACPRPDPGDRGAGAAASLCRGGRPPLSPDRTGGELSHLPECFAPPLPRPSPWWWRRRARRAQVNHLRSRLALAVIHLRRLPDLPEHAQREGNPSRAGGPTCGSAAPREGSVAVDTRNMFQTRCTGPVTGCRGASPLQPPARRTPPQGARSDSPGDARACATGRRLNSRGLELGAPRSFNMTLSIRSRQSKAHSLKLTVGKSRKKKLSN